MNKSTGMLLMALVILCVLLSPAARSEPEWLVVSYADLLDKDAVIRTGQTLGSVLGDSTLKGALQPFLDRYSELLPSALEFSGGPLDPPGHNIADYFPPETSQPAWVAILRGGRIHIATDEQGRAWVFLPGEDPEQAYQKHYSVIRHSLKMLSDSQSGVLNVDVYAYRNDYAASELRLNRKPWSFRAGVFPPRKIIPDLEGLRAFFAKGPTLEGVALSRDRGLILYGREGAMETLAGKPIEISDLAVAYRAVFHAGDNEAFISLDPHKDPSMVTVNFGGFLENTRIGSIVLEADKRFKTFTCGLDPAEAGDLRSHARKHNSSFLTSAERELLTAVPDSDGKWIGTRFWYYPDTVGIDSDPQLQFARIHNPRFTADAERTRDDFNSPEEFERNKRDTLSPAIRENIDDLNKNYTRYARAFPELSELETVARLMALCSWLSKACPEWLDCDELLRVELPSCPTETERTQMIAATFLSVSKGEKPDREKVIAESRVVFLSPVLDKTVNEYFESPADIVAFLSGKSESSRSDQARLGRKAASLYNDHGHRRVRDILQTKQDMELLAMHAAGKADVPLSASMKDLEGQMTSDENSLDIYDSAIRKIKDDMRGESSRENYNALAARHNRLVEEYEKIRTRYNSNVARYEALDIEVLSVLEIGGGISMEPSKFVIKQDASSPRLKELKILAPAVRTDWTQTKDSGRWVRSAAIQEKPPAVKETVERRLPGYRTGHWKKTDYPDGSWKSASTYSGGRSREKYWDGMAQELEIRDYKSGFLQSRIIAGKDARGRIIFRKAASANSSPPPEYPPTWAPGR